MCQTVAHLRDRSADHHAVGRGQPRPGAHGRSLARGSRDALVPGRPPRSRRDGREILRLRAAPEGRLPVRVVAAFAIIYGFGWLWSNVIGHFSPREAMDFWRTLTASPPAPTRTAMIRGFFVLLLFQLVGEVLARGLALPAPGPVIGLALLVAALAGWDAWRPFDDEALASSDLGQAATGLLGNLSLLFVPAGVGVVQYLGLLKAHSVALSAALIISTVLTMLATVVVFLFVKRMISLRSEA